jgi:hypothetical protein
MRFFLRLLLVPLIAASLCLPALAAPQRKPDAEIKTKTIEASVTIDPVLKAYPGLYPRLLAAGKREMSKWRAAADKDYRENAKMFRELQGYSFERAYKDRSAIQGYVSILRMDYTYSTGAAHPNHGIDTLLWDSGAREFINIRPFFKETRPDGPTLRTLVAAIKKAVVAAKIKRGMSAKEASDPMWLGGIKPALTKIGGVALAPSTKTDRSAGLIVYFGPYAVGSYAEGDYIVFVPWTAFRRHLSAAGARLFGGTRPPGDTKRDAP